MLWYIAYFVAIGLIIDFETTITPFAIYTGYTKFTVDAIFATDAVITTGAIFTIETSNTIFAIRTF